MRGCLANIFVCDAFFLFFRNSSSPMVLGAGVVPGIFPRGADSSDEGAKIWISGYYKCQKSPKKSRFTFRRGLACSDGGL